MKICVVVPTKEYLTQAGSRIRYGRIRDELGALNVQLETEIIDNFRGRMKYPHDIYLLSKCYDSGSIALAATLAKAGKVIGIDLFDDYFSQSQDSRLTHLREWLRKMEGFLDFVLCSTSRLRDVAADFFPGLPGHVLNDPFGNLDANRIGRLCQDKVERAQITRTLKIGWFGMGDNPYFSVGLQDLVAFSPSLFKIRDLGYDVQLSILTNTRALTASTLETLRWLGVPYTLDEWTKEKEAEQIADSDACFLPVNGQAFSIVKSLNRAVSTLTGGAQVLSSGYPLYAPLGAFLYRNPAALVADIESGQPLIRAETIPTLLTVLDKWANPRVEAGNLAGFLGDQMKQKGTRPASAAHPCSETIGILHGRRSSSRCHKLAQRLGHFSIGTPFSPATLNYDIVLNYIPNKRRIDLYLSEAAQAWLAPVYRPRLIQRSLAQNKLTKMVVEGVWEDASLSRQLDLLQVKNSTVSVTTFYAPVMDSLRSALHTLFPTLQCFISEMDPTCWIGATAATNAGARRMAREEVT